MHTGCRMLCASVFIHDMPSAVRSSMCCDHISLIISKRSSEISLSIIRLAEGCRSLHDPNLRKCNNHLLVSFIKVEGLFVSYIVHIFDIIKSRT
ncbi:predicted protein [Micromonas commoda]|uniref:Uncharacterized protein n=1 Tax=Micromonas commoda (strain RCC299 / NOUM17 / CCMP2709) TaxID=296587 RepID=C1EJN9_MICCC|nr:predicted protein [Micromonas commoda]ACO68221.1 predicted protein [Micromonas commoda]|eukprot:XP_002506963.1 predicted protein [Micromonas commoda]